MELLVGDGANPSFRWGRMCLLRFEDEDFDFRLPDSLFADRTLPVLLVADVRSAAGLIFGWRSW